MARLVLMKLRCPCTVLGTRALFFARKRLDLQAYSRCLAWPASRDLFIFFQTLLVLMIGELDKFRNEYD